mmetsp:Transcript_17026/g.20046  ORF Transcript_17026/g.20046 Transcript_17026/m.20046 type:complete len:345 (-) Transcript_17026:42-1076(-)
MLAVLQRHASDNKEKTIVISRVSTQATTSLINSAGLLADVETNVQFSPPNIPFNPFDWGTQTEGQGTEGAVDHLLNQLKNFDIALFSAMESQARNHQTGGYELLNVSSEHELLNIETENFKISGGSDAVIVPSGMRLFKHQQICCVFELKTHIPNLNATFPNQLIVEAVAAQMKSKQPVLAIETDLHSSHAFGVFFEMGQEDKVSVRSVRYESLAAMAYGVSQFLATHCEPRVVGVSKRRFNSGGDGATGGGGSSRDNEDGGNDDDGIDGSEGGDSHRTDEIMVTHMNKRARGNLSLTQEHFNDHIDDTEPLSDERATMVDHLFQSYGYTIPSYSQIAVKRHVF